MKPPLHSIVFVGIAALLPAGGCARSKANDNPSAKPIKAKVVSVASRQIKRVVESVGSCFAFEEVTVGSEVEGRVAAGVRRHRRPGGRGRPLVKIVPVELSLTSSSSAPR